jgi:diamine N-acetyltransferase
MIETGGEVEIRLAEVSDAGLLSVLGAVTFYEAYYEQDDPPDLAGYILQTYEVNRIRLELEDPGSVYFLLFFEGKAVGYAKLRLNSSVECVPNKNAVELQRIYLVERMFGRGIGDRLMGHCLSFAERNGATQLWLGVWEENRRAQKFYDKHGFYQVGTVTFPYGDTVGINWVMVKDLEPAGRETEG